jgi:hypothetical protein
LSRFVRGLEVTGKREEGSELSGSERQLSFRLRPIQTNIAGVASEEVWPGFFVFVVPHG